MKKSLVWFVCVTFLVFGASVAGALTFDLTGGKGDFEGPNADTQGAIFMEFTDAMQESVSAGTGVIDPFLTIKQNVLESAFNSDYWSGGSGVEDAHRDVWNHSITMSDLIGASIGGLSYYEFLLDINQNSGGDSSLLTQHELEIYVVPEAAGGSIETYAALVAAAGAPVWDLDAGPAGDSEILLDYDIWSGSGQNIDMGVYIPTALFAGADDNDFIYLWAKFGTLDDAGFPSNDGFEEYILREGGQSIPDASTLLLLGSAALMGFLGTRRKSMK
jgi:hypothetical protein